MQSIKIPRIQTGRQFLSDRLPEYLERHFKYFRYKQSILFVYLFMLTTDFKFDTMKKLTLMYRFEEVQGVKHTSFCLCDKYTLPIPLEEQVLHSTRIV